MLKLENTTYTYILQGGGLDSPLLEIVSAF